MDPVTYEDEDGIWAVDGAARYLIDPSEAFEAKRGEAYAPAPTPDPNGFLLAAIGVFATEEDPTGLVRGNAVLSRWPSFSTALLQSNWAVARATLTAALSIETVTQEEHEALEALFDTYHIPPVPQTEE